MESLPEQYCILPATIPFDLTGFHKAYTDGRTLALRDRTCAAWFDELVARVEQAIATRSYLPICRMSDGEFKFAVGEQPESIRLNRVTRAMLRLRRWLFRVALRGGFGARTRPGVSSGAYTRAEWLKAREQYPAMVRSIADQGVLALHLSYGRVPFQEHYFPAFGQWLHANDIRLTDDNYYPFYFVYALLSGPARHRVIRGRRVLLVNSADEEKRRRIARSLLDLGAREIHWLPISAARSLFDRIDPSPFIGRVDVAFVGAGVGKPNVLLQLEPLAVPCIDAGYMFEVWADPTAASARAYCSYIRFP